MADKFIIFVLEGLFSDNSNPTDWSKKSDSGCYSFHSFTQPCDFSNQLNFSENIVKWPQ